MTNIFPPFILNLNFGRWILRCFPISNLATYFFKYYTLTLKKSLLLYFDRAFVFFFKTAHFKVLF